MGDLWEVHLVVACGGGRVLARPRTPNTMTLKKPRSAAAALSVMLVDDEDDSRELVGELLRLSGGFQVSTFENAEDAFGSLDRSIPHVVVTDVRLPGIDGYELAARLKKDVRTKHVPIVAMTGVATPRATDSQSPFSSYIVKPTSIDALIAEIRRLVPRKSVAVLRHA